MLPAALVVAVLSLGSAAGGGGWSWPVTPPVLVHGFDPPPQPWLAGNRGVDLAAPAGSPVRAAGAGIVRFAGLVAGIPVVSVSHPDGLVTTYEPVRAAVRRGDSVDRGTILGRLVRFGSHCLPRACLHWGVRRGADYVDPLALLGLGEVRLLPMSPTTPVPGLPPVLPAAGSIAVIGTMAVRQRRIARLRQSGGGSSPTLPSTASRSKSA